MTYVEIARQVIQKQSMDSEGSRMPPELQPVPLEQALRDRTVELWSTSAGRLFLVADEEDAQSVVKQFGAGRGEVYTAAEARRIVAVKDPSIVAEIHDWKRQLDGVLRNYQKGTTSI